jgi:hypothetical protein
MDKNGLLFGIAALLTAVGGFYAARVNRRSAELANKIELAKSEAVGKAETIKAGTDAEIRRTDQLLDTQMDFIRDLQKENRDQRQEMIEKDKQHRDEMLQIRNEVIDLHKLMSVCIEERGKFKGEMDRVKAMYDVLIARDKSLYPDDKTQ